jgi:hypothetical protein
VKPDRLREEATMMWEYAVRLLALGVEAGEFRIDDPERDARVLLFSVAYFYPNALSEPPFPPKEKDLLFVVDWFLDTWKRNAAGSAKRKR